jgi:hypothetical protein
LCENRKIAAFCLCLTLFPFLRGFCYFNSVAVAAKLLQQRLNVSKILIVDWVSGLPIRVKLGRAMATYLFPGREPGWEWTCTCTDIGTWGAELCGNHLKDQKHKAHTH